MAIKTKDIKKLYALCGNKCAFDGCANPIFEDSGVLTGECAHIKAQSANGPRYDKNQTMEERDGYENLIMLCSRHHTIIDQEVEKYPVDRLQKIKQEHEAKFGYKLLLLDGEMIQKIKLSQQIHKERLIDTNINSEYIELQANINPEANIEEVFNRVSEVVNSLIDVSNKFKDLAISAECIFDRLGIEIPTLRTTADTPYFSRIGDSLNMFYNVATLTKLELQHLLVKIFEIMTETNHKYYTRLQEERHKLEIIHQKSFVD